MAAATAFATLGGGDILFPVSGAANVLFTHDGHAGTAKIGCKECHYAIYTNRANHKSVSMAEMKNGKSCGACHNGIRAFSVAPAGNCPRCHR
jgi:c(7)-type cytochrome triheme protein